MRSIPVWLYNKYIAHRGYFNKLVPENSLKSFQSAIDNGYAIEFDIQLLKDDTIIVFHDDDLSRMTNKSKIISECIYSDIEGIKLLNTNECIPTLKETLDLIDGKIPLMIEFKTDKTDNNLEKHAYELLKNYTGEYVVQSFNPSVIKWFRFNATEVIRGQLSCKNYDMSINIVNRFILRYMVLNIITKPDYIMYDINDLKTLPIRISKIFKKKIFGYTAKSADDYTKAKKNGVISCFEGFDPSKL